MIARLLLSGSYVGLSAFLLSGMVVAKPPAAEEKPHWAFQPVRRPAVPATKDRSWIRNPIDIFVLARLEKAGIKPVAPADKPTLLRRIYLDAIGLPPSPEELQAFLNDPSDRAYERVVDDLLARSQYGERWARHWLDVVRYAESNGYERDGAKPFAWRYRDYVVDSLNKDKPYDRFLTEQIAGDEIEGSNAETQIATTFLRLGTWDDEPADPLVDRYDQLDDVLGTTATAFLGVTLRCARCHDHKFEPFPQTDYYNMLAIFEPLKRPQKDREELDRLVGTEADLARYQAALAKPLAQVAAIQKQLGALKQKIRERVLASALDARADLKRPALPPEAVAAFLEKAEKRSTAQKALVKKFTAMLEAEIQKVATTQEKAENARLEKEIVAINAQKPSEPPRAYIWYEEGVKAPVTHLFRRGNPTKLGKPAEPAVPAVLAQKQPDPPRPTTRSTGRRLWLARWMTSPDNPLTARVLVNRIWQHHFGEGLVATENDFGVMGQPPSHPELLDWLASEFVAQGWSLKGLHRLILLSNTYQMSCASDARAAKLDSENKLLWRQRQRRLEAETLRDATLAVSGQLNPQMGGPSIYPRLPQAVLDGQSRPGDGWGKSEERQSARRSVYIFVKRSLAVPELDLLDMPDTTSSCDHRPVSTTGPQALTFMNGEFMRQQARHFADRLQGEAGQDEALQADKAFALALCRSPRPAERQGAVEFLKLQRLQIESDARRLKRDNRNARRQALEALCLVLLNTNEFAYVN
ncbi:MAG TPA: DUF1549 and DUF1553 domain-containing protein [Gemmataceae bacterium]|nr:DUF1549 and DUF1553 domain-containing protein [Gemmataceae bacterium]